ncbi:MAG: hypothetical protein IT452_10450 [Planctomycetia bacterium]|nr:hypothetical protein [Planctomycetia bacterium]
MDTPKKITLRSQFKAADIRAQALAAKTQDELDHVRSLRKRLIAELEALASPTEEEAAELVLLRQRLEGAPVDGVSAVILTGQAPPSALGAIVSAPQAKISAEASSGATPEAIKARLAVLVKGKDDGEIEYLTKALGKIAK